MREGESQGMLRRLEELLQVSASVFTCVRHEVYDRAIVTFDDDFLRGMRGKMLCREQDSMCSTGSLRMSCISTGKEGYAVRGEM